ncbi:MAG: RHS repeat protein, partial [Acidobacteriaceae bacterium]|nr:RHS repeat protein [Acidobacteriaceae bacterium]
MRLIRSETNFACITWAWTRTCTRPSRYTNGTSDGLGYATNYSYDALGRTTQVKTADGAVASTSYSGNVTTVTDQAGNQRSSNTDARGRLTQVVEDPGSSPHLNYVTSYSYDALDDLRTVTQSGQSRSFSYDGRGLLLSANNPESGAVTYSYDAAGNLATRTDNRSIKTSYSYDALNRLTQKTYSDGTPTASYTYDTGGANARAIGQLTQVLNANSVTNYTNFDARGEVVSSNQTTGGQVYTLGYAYNLAGALTAEMYPSGRTVTTGYDTANRPAAVQGTLNGPAKSYASQVNYLPHGGLYYFTAGNNLVPVYNYNSRLQISNLWTTVNNNSSHFLLNLVPNWGTTNNNGNLLSVSEGYGNSVPAHQLSWLGQNYSYDRLNRLSSVADTGYTRSFSYDAYGNMWVTGNSGIGLAGNTPTSNVFNG